LGIVSRDDRDGDDHLAYAAYVVVAVPPPSPPRGSAGDVGAAQHRRRWLRRDRRFGAIRRRVQALTASRQRIIDTQRPP
jgi:hypothetical protein